MLRTFLLVAVLLMAGCTSNDPDAGAMPTTASSSSTSQVPPPPPPPAVYVGSCEDEAAFSISASGIGVQDGAECPFAAAFEGDLTLLRGAVVELAWTPAQPSMMGAALYLTSDSCYRGASLSTAGPEVGQCDHGALYGTTSPLRLELGPSLLADFGADNLVAQAAPDGATVDQGFTFYITLFEGDVPPGFSAIP